MQKRVKENLLQLINSMNNAHAKLCELSKVDERLSVLQGCQEAAIIVGETIEKELSEDKKCVPTLEDYCESLFALSQVEWVTREQVEELSEYLEKVKEVIVKVQARYRIAFLPYKAEMWDSLESIWLACKADERCECAVVPIPYFAFNATEQKWEYRYDGDRFPEYVPVIPYDKYVISEMCPDVAYIHNPYDNYNYVTSVHPDYYSFELKKYVDKLVYLPYYVTPGWIADDHKHLSVYNHMDYMIAQSEYAKESCKELPYHDKMIALGSPKFDKIIRQCREKESVFVPEEWKVVLEGKKIVFWNTSITDLLVFGDVLFQKMYYAFSLIREMENVAVIWRPHPLLESTMRSMRPALLEKFQELKKYFIEQRIGVYDDTPQVETAIVLSDAYVDACFSSVANMVGAAGKPIFYLNNNFYEDVTAKQQRSLQFYDLARQNDRIWFTTEYNALFYMDLSEKQIRFAGRMENEGKWSVSFAYITSDWDKLYLSPYVLHTPLSYEYKSGRFKSMFQSEFADSLKWGKNVLCGDSIFYLPISAGYIAEYQISAGTWNFHSECIQELWDDIPKDGEMYEVWDYAVYDGCIWIMHLFANRVLQFFMADGSFKIHEIGSGNSVYNGIEVDEGGLWLVSSGQELIRADFEGKLIETYSLPKANHVWRNYKNLLWTYLKLCSMGQYLVALPHSCDCLIKFDKRTKESKRILEDFFADAEKSHNGYVPELLSAASYMSNRIDERYLLVQRMTDRKLALIDIETETYEMIDSALSDEEFARFVGEDDGFEKADRSFGFMRRENEIFTLRDFIEDVSQGNLDDIKERQIAALQEMAVNLDGTCGEKVHEFIMGEL